MSLISRLHHIFQGTHENEYDGTIMEFEDPEVKKYLVAIIGGENGITNPEFGVPGVKGIAGEVTYEQVLACKRVDFEGNQNIRRFNELEYFKNLTEVRFRESSVEEVSLPYMTISKDSNFKSCRELRKLTTKYGLEINNGEDLLYNCTSLTTLDTSKWNLSNLSNGSSMFDGCTSLQTLDTSKWNFSNLTNGSYMFYNCTSLQSIGDTSEWNLSNLTNGTAMFSNCTSLTTLDTSGWDFSNLSNGYCMFQSCTSLQTLDTSEWNLSNLTNGTAMFNNCTSLTTLDTSGWNLSNLTNGSYMFQSCTSLQTLDTSEWGSLDKIITVERMFRSCTSLVSIDLSDKLENCKNSKQYLVGCKNLESLVGNHTETDKVRLFKGRLGNINFSYFSKINLATVNAVIRGVGSSPDKKLTLTLPEPVKSQVTEEYKIMLKSKNWEID